MELRPCEPECFVTSKVCAVLIDGFDATRYFFQFYALNGNVLACAQRRKGFGALEGDGFARGGDDADDVFVDGQAGVYVAHREDRAACIAVVAEVKITAKGEGFHKDGGVWMQRFPCAPIGGDDGGLFQLDAFLCRGPVTALPRKVSKTE